MAGAATEIAASGRDDVRIDGAEKLSEVQRRNLESYLDHYSSAPVHVIKDIADVDSLDLSEEDRQEFRNAIATGDIPAVYCSLDGKVYIFADRFDIADHGTVLLHENIHALVDRLGGLSDELGSLRENILQIEPHNKMHNRLYAGIVREYEDATKHDEEFLAYLLSDLMMNRRPERLASIIESLSEDNKQFIKQVIFNLTYGKKEVGSPISGIDEKAPDAYGLGGTGGYGQTEFRGISGRSAEGGSTQGADGADGGSTGLRTDPEPTEAQKEAGNYKKKHVRVDGHQITIENERGSVRRGRDRDGKEWHTEIHND